MRHANESLRYRAHIRLWYPRRIADEHCYLALGAALNVAIPLNLLIMRYCNISAWLG